MDGIEITNPYETTTRGEMKKVLFEKAMEFMAMSNLSRKKRRELARISSKQLMGKVEKVNADV